MSVMFHALEKKVYSVCAGFKIPHIFTKFVKEQ